MLCLVLMYGWPANIPKSKCSLADERKCFAGTSCPIFWRSDGPGLLPRGIRLAQTIAVRFESLRDLGGIVLV